MSPKRRHLLLWSAAALIALAGPVVILIAWILPIHVDASSAQAIPPLLADPAATNPATLQIDLDELQQLAARDLRRPWSGDAASAGTTAPTGTPLTLQLVAIASESGHSLAMLRKSDGALAICAVGDSVEDVGGPATVTRIEVDRISLTYGGAARELTMPRNPANAEGLAP